jgi:hypothetical protein
MMYVYCNLIRIFCWLKYRMLMEIFIKFVKNTNFCFTYQEQHKTYKKYQARLCYWHFHSYLHRIGSSLLSISKLLFIIRLQRLPHLPMFSLFLLLLFNVNSSYLNVCKNPSNAHVCNVFDHILLLTNTFPSFLRSFSR